MKCCNCDREATKRVVFKDGREEKSLDFCRFCHCAWNWGWACRDDDCELIDDDCGEDYIAGGTGEQEASE